MHECTAQPVVAPRPDCMDGPGMGLQVPEQGQECTRQSSSRGSLEGDEWLSIGSEQW